MPHLPLLQRSLRLQQEALNVVGEYLARKAAGDGELDTEALLRIQVQAFDMARWISECAAVEALLHHAEREPGDDLTRRICLLYSADAATRLAGRLAMEHAVFGLSTTERLDEFLDISSHLRNHLTPEGWSHIGDDVISRGADWSGADGLDDVHQEMKKAFAKFSDTVIAPLAEHIHRKDSLVPDSVLARLAELGAFGISIPQEYGGSFFDHAAMVIATEELSRGSLGAGGSVLTRPEICAKALLAGGTEEQKRRWLPAIAAGEKMVCIAVTEPDTGSDVARVSLTARRTAGGYVLNGEKTWATFAGRSEILCVLARTGRPDEGHRGLSLFLVEKPYDPGTDHHQFRYEQPGGGVIEGRAIPTIGYRGMHSFSVSFQEYVVQEENLIGEEGRGFYLQMQGFSGGRIQTAARAVGVMEAALRSAIDYVRSRKLFGRHLADFPLTKFKIGQMASRIHANRQLAYAVAMMMDGGEASAEPSLVKLLSCRDAEWVTREAMQLHGGMGYSEEYPVSRYFVDARVLSIFEGAEEILALQVIARPFLERCHQGVAA